MVIVLDAQLDSNKFIFFMQLKEQKKISAHADYRCPNN